MNTDSRYDTPTGGTIYTIESPLPQFADGCIYLIGGVPDDFDVKTFELTLNGIGFGVGPRSKTAGKYDFYAVPLSFEIKMPEQMRDFMAENGYNLLLPIFMPSTSEKQYMLYRTDYADPDYLARMMMHTAENLSDQSVRAVVCDLALNDPDSFLDEFDDLFSTRDFLVELSHTIRTMVTGTKFGGMRMFPMGHTGAVAGGVAVAAAAMQGFKARLKFRKDVEKRLMKGPRARRSGSESATKSDEAEKIFKLEVQDVVSSIDSDLLLAFIDKLPPRMRQKFMNMTNPDFVAQQSTMTIEIRDVVKQQHKMSAIQKMQKNDGRIQLFLTKAKLAEQHIHFDSKNAFIIYTMYLIDKKERGYDIDSIDITKKYDAYRKIYEIAYPGDVHRCRNNFLSLQGLRINEDTGKEESREPTLKKCYREIRMLVGDACAALDEHAVCHTIADEHGHLYTRPEQIRLSERLKNIKVEE